jgi:hypothetical protein
VGETICQFCFYSHFVLEKLYSIANLTSRFILLYKYNFKELKRRTEKPWTVTPKEISQVPSDRRTLADRSVGVVSQARQMVVSFHRIVNNQAYTGCALQSWDSSSYPRRYERLLF